MAYLLCFLLLFAQADGALAQADGAAPAGAATDGPATGEGPAEGKKDAGKQAPQPGPGGMLFMYLPLLLILFLVFNMMFNNPQKKEQKRVDALKSQLKKNDRIETAGGIIGTVVEVHQDKDEVTIRVDDNARLRMRLRSVYVPAQSAADKAKTESSSS